MDSIWQLVQSSPTLHTLRLRSWYRDGCVLPVPGHTPYCWIDIAHMVPWSRLLFFPSGLISADVSDLADIFSSTMTTLNCLGRSYNGHQGARGLALCICSSIPGHVLPHPNQPTSI